MIAHHALRPLLAITAHGVQVSPRTTSPEDATLQLFGSKIIRTPFTVDLDEAFKKDQLTALALGVDAQSVFRFRYFEGDEAAVFTFGRVDLQMFLGHVDGSSTAMTKHTEMPPCLLSFDFGPTALAQLSALLAPKVHAALMGMLAEHRPFRVPPGSVAVGVRAHLGGEAADGTTQFIVEEWLPAGPASIAVEF